MVELVQNYNDKFAVIGFSSITNCAKILRDLLQLESIEKMIYFNIFKDASIRIAFYLNPAPQLA